MSLRGWLCLWHDDDCTYKYNHHHVINEDNAVIKQYQWQRTNYKHILANNIFFFVRHIRTGCLAYHRYQIFWSPTPRGLRKIEPKSDDTENDGRPIKIDIYGCHTPSRKQSWANKRDQRPHLHFGWEWYTFHYQIVDFNFYFAISLSHFYI